MLHRKLEVELPEGTKKETLMQLIAAWQDKPNVCNHRTLWRKAKELVPEFKDVKVVHFSYEPMTEKLCFREGHSDRWYIKYTF
jgi:hypothetical protein